MKALWEDTRYLFYTLFHPFNGFYELRFHRRKNWVLIGLLYLLYGVVQILKTYYSGMLVGADPYGTNNLVVFAFSLFPFLLFSLSNWSVTTLFDGNGKMGDVLMVLAYALFPKLITDVLYTALSNVVVKEELAILNVIGGFGTVILTTHYLEEAEALADRIGIMSRGRMQVVGTVEEIKRETGAATLEDAFLTLTDEEVPA